MSDAAIRNAASKHRWAAPGGSHDAIVRVLKIALPSLIGVLLAYLAMAPLSRSQEISFILDKSKVEVAKERMRVQTAEYRGQDNKGRPFSVAARSAVQATSQQPLVDINDVTARIGLSEGPAALRALKGRYNLETQQMAVMGPILFTGPEGYRLATSDVIVDLNEQTLASRGEVQGTMPLGRFTADRLQADLADRRVVLDGRARLHIVQGKR